MNLDPYISEARTLAAQTVMTARCTITRGTYPNHADVDTDVPCGVRPSDRVAREDELASGGVAHLHLFDVRLPYDQDVVKGDVLTITTSRDPQLEGRYLTVVQVLTTETVTTRTVICEESRAS